MASFTIGAMGFRFFLRLPNRNADLPTTAQLGDQDPVFLDRGFCDQRSTGKVQHRQASE
jgi:hypothetical protein